MNNAAHQVSAQSPAQFGLIQRRIKCQHQFQFYLDFGQTADGPWARVGLNDMEYLVGYVPQKMMRPTPPLKVVAREA